MEALLLLRHAAAGSNRDGTTSCRPPGATLTAEGIEQARAVAEHLAGEEISLGIATRLRRTQETLAHALGARQVPRLVVPELDEIHFGSFDGGSLAEYRAWAASHPPDQPAPGGGESRADAAARFARGLGVVVGRRERVVLLVGHALFVRYVLDAAAGLVPAPVMTPVDHATPYRLDVRDAEAAARLLSDWSRAPRFRDPPEEGGGLRP
jgi:broad specificity phosphatase PhoE